MFFILSQLSSLAHVDNCHSIDKSNHEEIKLFYKEHSSTIFYCVYTSFTIVETNIHDRGKCRKHLFPIQDSSFPQVIKNRKYNDRYHPILKVCVIPGANE